MPQQIIFQDNLVTDAPNLTDRFTNAVGFVISASLIEEDIEIDCFLQIYIPAAIGEIVRVVDIGKIIEQTVYINVTDTETCQVIPSEFLDTDLEMALLFVASEPVFLQAAIIKKNCSITEVCDRLEQLQSEIDYLKVLNQEILTVLDVVPPPPPPPVPVSNATEAGLFFFF